jgi:hypothetical protein
MLLQMTRLSSWGQEVGVLAVLTWCPQLLSTAQQPCCMGCIGWMYTRMALSHDV